MITWGHNILPHRHGDEGGLIIALAGHVHTHDHHHHEAHSHGQATSWLEWLKHQLSNFNHPDFGENHLEYYFIKTVAQQVYAPGFNFLVPEFFIFNHYRPAQASTRPYVPAARAPDPPDENVRRGRAPPFFFG